MSETEFPDKGMRKRQQVAWLEANNPYPPETPAYYGFASRFYGSQAAIFGRRADRLGRWAVRLFIAAAAFQVVALGIALAERLVG